ncbi:MAG: T9SS type A sorting domain-containing protein [Chitinophagaceae bacterium]|nr:MAG: T9SS type A sorting domain-containing protein [Chitinophagaceae bacterium]
MKRMLLAGLCFIATSVVTAQDNTWTPNNNAGKIATAKGVARQSFPTSFKLFNLDAGALKQQLFSVVGRNAARHSTVINLPNAAGQLEQFEVFEASNFDETLQAQFPEIRAFSGKGITDPYASLKLSYSPQGIQTMVFRTEKPNEFIEAYSADSRVYAVFKSERKAGTLGWRCSTPDEQLANGLDARIQQAGITQRSGGDLKKMRLAQSCNAEYANYFGATSASQVNLVLAAFNATLTRCNGVYEKDLALHLNLVAASTSVIYYNPSTDPYSTTLSSWNLSLQQTLTANIGNANYDIGHMFGASGGGGNAGCIGCVCVNPANNNSLAKGAGITSPADGIPQGDNFDIDYVVHEVGHQLGANHTFSYASEGTGVNKEVGSGITIMGYAGITSYDVAPHSIEFYHQASIAQIQANLATKTCPVTTTLTGNATPVLNAVGNYTIPISTPFALTGSASDANGDALTYSWEQNDNSTTTGANSKASPTKTTGPNWISFRPSTSSTRVFPQLSTILAGGLTTAQLPGGDANTTIEALSSVSRTLNFRLTVRDNAPYSASAPVSVGQTQFTDMVVTVSNTSGPFAVTAPNTNLSWAGNSTQTITWSVANTTAAPVSCANVKISLSTDGGLTFPTVLVASTANDGSEAVSIPATPTNTARIKIEAVGNIFFDISNSNFTISGALACGDPTGLTSSAIGNNTATISWSAVSGANNYDVDYKTNASATWTNVATGTTALSVGLTGLSSGTLYDWRVRANCASGSSSYSAAQFTSTSPAVCNASVSLSSSAVTASSATLSWAAASGGISYDVDYKLSSASTWTAAAAATTATSVNLSGLSAASVYDWRVRTNCSSGSSAYSAAQFTTQSAGGCNTAFEPNESMAAAAAITAGVANSAAISSSTDNDYFKITTTGSSNNVFTLAGPSGVDYDLTIYNSAGTSIGTGTSGTANETVSLNNQAAGTYYIRVFGYNGANSATCYTITAGVTPVAQGCQSVYDVSTNGTATGAATIPFNTDVKGLISPSGDNDYYKFVITTGGTATVTLTTLPADYELAIYSSNGTTQLASSTNGSTTSETISRTYTAGTYYARVWGYNNANNANSCYTLKVQLGTAAKNEIAVNEAAVLRMSPNPTSNLLNVSLLGTEVNRQSVLQVMDVNGKIIMEQPLKRNTQSVDVSKLPAGNYVVRILNGAAIITSKFVKQ